MASRCVPLNAVQHAELIARAESVIRDTQQMSLGDWNGVERWAMAVLTLEATRRADLLMCDRPRLEDRDDNIPVDMW